MSAGPAILTAEPTGGAGAAAGAQGGAAATTDWRASLPEDLRGDKSFETIKDVGSLAKQFLDSQKMIGGSVRLPKADAPAADWDKVYARLGRPESPDKYELKRPDALKDGPWDEGMEKNFKTWAHKTGLNPRQAQDLMNEYAGAQAEMLAAHRQATEAGIAGLKKEWGAGFDTKVAAAAKAVNELGGDDLKKLLNESGLGNHPVLVKLFAELGESLGEGVLVTGSEDGGGAEGPDAVRAKIDAIRNDPKHPYNDPKADHQQRQRAVEEVRRLYATLMPEAS